MDLSFAQVENALALTHGIVDEKRSAFASRLKHLQKLGFPPGTNTGRGRAANYRAEHLFLLGVVLELNQLGVSPERAIAVAQAGLPSIARGIRNIIRAGPPSGGRSKTFFFAFDPAVLADLMGMDTDEQRKSISARCIGLKTFRGAIERWGEWGLRRLALVNLSQLIWDLAEFSQGSPTEQKVFFEDLFLWAETVVRPDGDT